MGPALAVLVFAADARSADPAPPPPAPAVTLRDQRLDPGDRIVGLVLAGEPRAYAVSGLKAAGSPVHDVVDGHRIDVTIDQDHASVLPATAPVTEKAVTTWARWSLAHPDTSIWHASAVPEPATARPCGDVLVQDVRNYRADLDHSFGQSIEGGQLESALLFVITGSVRNASAVPVHHVVLRVELVDETGKVVYRDESYNRSAEALADEKLDDPARVAPIAPGATDTFRMILMSDELPVFKDSRVTVARVY